MIKRFGYEKKSKDSPFIQAARSYYLGLIPGLKPYVIQTLLLAAFQSFNALLLNSKNAIDSIYKLVESEALEPILRTPQAVKEQALKRFVPDWCSLQRIKGARAFRQVLQDWAQEQNLTDDWCLDHAVSFLRHFIAKADRINWQILEQHPHVYKYYLDKIKAESWLCAIRERDDAALLTQFKSNKVFEESDVYSFLFKYKDLEIAESGPFYRPTSDFNKEVKERFEMLGGRNIKGARKALGQQKTLYLQKVKKVAKKTLKEPPARRRTEDHLKWLIEYQVPERLSVPQLLKKYRLPFKTVDSGIKAARKLIQLSPPTKSFKGRKLGKGGPRKPTLKERKRNLAQLEGIIKAFESLRQPEIRSRVAREVQISPNHFRSSVIPRLLEQTRCRDYEALLSLEGRNRLKQLAKKQRAEILRE